MNHLTKVEVEHMERELTLHYGEPVRRISAYCNAFEAWHKALGEKIERDEHEGSTRDEGLYTAHQALSTFGLRLAIMKSAMLGRLIYAGEGVRTEMCPVHKGRWCGLSAEANGGCDHGCDLTGWLPL